MNNLVGPSFRLSPGKLPPSRCKADYDKKFNGIQVLSEFRSRLRLNLALVQQTCDQQQYGQHMKAFAKGGRPVFAL